VYNLIKKHKNYNKTDDRLVLTHNDPKNNIYISIDDNFGEYILSGGLIKMKVMKKDENNKFINAPKNKDVLEYFLIENNILKTYVNINGVKSSVDL
jgi:hypothetical protein